MAGFRDLSIQRKLTAIIMLTTVSALVLASIAFFAVEILTFRDKIVRDFRLLAATMQANTQSALLYNDRLTAEENLGSLAAQPHVVAAWIFDDDGDLFASYLRRGEELEAPSPVQAGDGERFVGNHLILGRGIDFNARRIGTFYIVSDLRERDERLVKYLGLLLLILILATVFAAVVSSRLQRVVSDPILDLARIARTVSQERDYSVRAPDLGDDEIGELYDGFNSMLTQIEKRDDDLRVARDRAEQANRAKSVFLANMSHELRTPLTAIIGYSEILEDDAEEMGLGDFLPDLQKIQTAGKHLLGLINSILDLSKIEAGKMELFIEKVEIKDLVSGVTATVRPLLDKNHNTLDLRIPDDLGTVRTDQTKTRQILYNLLSNASKFTRNGRVLVEVERSGAGAEERIFFRVKDEGIGMTSEEIGRLFKPFSQADATTARNYGGTGLGLALCKRFAELMGGGIDVRSAKGEGSTFTVFLPVEVEALHPESVHQRLQSGEWANEESSDGMPGDARRVLVIDDDLAIQEVLRAFLRREGYRVLTAKSGEEGIRLARQQRPDLITLDVNLPDLDGWDVLSRLKSDLDLAEIPVFMLTVDEDQKRGFALGASEYLTKPIERTRLAAVLERYRGDGETPLGMVIDDDSDIRRLLRGLLEEQAWTVVEAEDGADAIVRLHKRIPKVILLDLLMPEMDGFEFLGKIRENPQWREIPVVVLTGMDLGPEERERLGGRVANVLQKNACSVEEIKSEIRALTRSPRWERSAGGGA